MGFVEAENERRGTVLKIVLLGAESTGKTTLGKVLAQYYRTQYKEEYGRTYYAENHFRMDLQDFVIVAERHREQEDALVKECRNNVMIVDTNALTTLYFSNQLAYGALPRLEELAHDCKKRYDLFLVMDTDAPYKEDAQRSGANMRDSMHAHIIEDLQGRGIEYHLLSGSVSLKLFKAVGLIDGLLAKEQANCR